MHSKRLKNLYGTRAVCSLFLLLLAVDTASSFSFLSNVETARNNYHSANHPIKSFSPAVLMSSSKPDDYTENPLTIDDDLDALDEYCEVVDEFGCEAFENFFETDEDFRWVRVEKKPDPSLQDINSQQDVLRKIEQVVKEQSQCGRSNAYRRRWEPVVDADDSINGEDINGEAGFVFSCMQFNALAEGLSAPPSVKKPFRINPNDGHTQKEKQSSGFGGFESISSPEVALDFSLRRWRLLEIILGSDAGRHFDVIAMEEIDRFFGFFAPVLRLFGYEGLFVPKVKSPCTRMGWYSDGCCLFWNKHTFELVSEIRRNYKGTNQVYIIAVLRHRLSNRHMVVAVTHLKAQRKEKTEKVRSEQIDVLLNEVSKAASRISKQKGKNDVPILILGDFNADPPHQNEFEVSSVQHLLQYELEIDERRRCLQSAYKIDPPAETFYTTWKTRGPETVRRIIDYIFYSGQIECQEVLQVPSESELEATKLPGLRHPSDHMMIAAKFKLE